MDLCIFSDFGGLNPVFFDTLFYFLTVFCSLSMFFIDVWESVWGNPLFVFKISVQNGCLV